MEFGGDKIARETQYFADPFEAGMGALNGSNGSAKGKSECSGNEDPIALSSDLHLIGLTPPPAHWSVVPRAGQVPARFGASLHLLACRFDTDH